MRQLVGRNCILCRGRISSVIDGRFCLACGCPVHNDCTTTPVTVPVGGCRACGASGADAAEHAAGAAQDIRERAAAPKPWDAPGYAPFYGAWGELRVFRVMLLGVSCCLAGLFGFAKTADRNDGGEAMMVGGAMLLFGGAYLFFGIRRVIEGNRAPPG
jgi:hypothetical protein